MSTDKGFASFAAHLEQTWDHVSHFNASSTEYMEAGAALSLAALGGWAAVKAGSYLLEDAAPAEALAAKTLPKLSVEELLYSDPWLAQVGDTGKPFALSHGSAFDPASVFGPDI